MTISVVLCTYNGARFVEEQLDSILTQVPAPDEIVWGDDGSSDGTPEIVARVMRERGGTTQLVTRTHGNLGVAANFADAAGHARGDIVVLSDQDDVWLPGKLAAIVDAFAADPGVLLVHSDARLVDEDGRPMGTLLHSLEASRTDRRRLQNGRGDRVLLRRNLVTGMTAAMRRELVEEAFPVGAGWIHDEWLAVIAASVGRIRLIPRVLADYRQHGANQIGAAKPSLSDKRARLDAPWEERIDRQIARTESLVAALERLGDRVPAPRLAAVRAKLEHWRWRRTLPAGALGRWPRVLAKAASGAYSRYSYGYRDVARDLFRPSQKRAGTLTP